MDDEGRGRFQKRYQESLLRRAPAWSSPTPFLVPRRMPPAPRGGWALVPLLVLVGLALLFLRPFLPESPVTVLGPKVERIAWPRGFDNHARLIVTGGSLVLMEGSRATALSAARPGRVRWVLDLPARNTILAAETNGSSTLVAIRQGRELRVVRLGAHGGVEHRTPLGKAVGPGVWIRPGPKAGFLVSDRNETYVVGADGRLTARIPGGSGSLLAQDAHGAAVVVSYTPRRQRLFLSTPSGLRVATVAEPLPGFMAKPPPSLGDAAHLIPIDAGAGFVFATGSAYIVPGQIGLRVEANGTGADAFAVTGPASADAHLVNSRRGTRVVFWDASSLGLALPLLPRYRGLALLDQAGTLLAARDGYLYALRPDGARLARTAGSPGAVAVGSRFAFVSNPSGILAFGPLAPPPHALRVRWSGASGDWHVDAQILPLSLAAPYVWRSPLMVTGPLNQPYRHPDFGSPAVPTPAPAVVSPILQTPDGRAMAARVEIRFVGPDPGQFNRVGTAEPPWWSVWWRVPEQQRGMGLVIDGNQSLLMPKSPPGLSETFYLPYTTLAWEAIEAGWTNLPRTVNWPITYRLSGHPSRERVSVTLHQETP